MAVVARMGKVYKVLVIEVAVMVVVTTTTKMWA